MLVRAGRADDLAALTALYNHYVVHDHATFDLEPFTVGQRRGWFDQYAPTGPHRLLVGADEGTVVGYATSGPFRAKPAYAGTVETTVYLHWEYGGRGVGTRLYGELLDQLTAERDVYAAVAGIAMPNTASVALHLRMGFQPVGTFTGIGYKFGRHIDVQWFQRRLT